MLSGLKFITKKHKDFLDWSFIAGLLSKGKHTTEAGRELIIRISKGMNNYRLSTNSHLKQEKVEIPQSLIDEVLNMKDIYIKDKEGLRINASTFIFVKTQLSYILAEGSKGKTLVFKGSTECANYFGVSSVTINTKLAEGLPVYLSGDDSVKFILKRKPL